MPRRRNDSESLLLAGNLPVGYNSICTNSPSKDPPFEDLKNGKPQFNKLSVHMEKRLKLIDGIGVIVGIMIGSGIFISPKGVIQYTQSPGMALVVWALSGLLTVAGALCYAELGRYEQYLIKIAW